MIGVREITSRVFGDYHRLGRTAGIILVAIAMAYVVANGIVFSLQGFEIVPFVLEVTFAIGALLMLWRPPIAIIAFLLLGFLGVPFDGVENYVAFLACVSGLVVYCGNWVLTGVYLTGTLTWMCIGTVSVSTPSATLFVGTLLLLGISTLMGCFMRLGRFRAQRLQSDVSRLSTARDEAILAERVRIADELHNIIAHDITIVVMNARALGMLEPSPQQQASVDAIEKSATQALTDIRRMLNVVNGTDTTLASESFVHETLGEVMEDAAAGLRAAGIEVSLAAEGSATLSESVNAALVHAVRESATNILKHAPGAPQARMRLCQDRDKVRLTVANACPARLGAEAFGDVAGSGYGLSRLETRVQLLGGSFASGAQSGPQGKEWRMEVTLPLV